MIIILHVTCLELEKKYINAVNLYLIAEFFSFITKIFDFLNKSHICTFVNKTFFNFAITHQKTCIYTLSLKSYRHYHFGSIELHFCAISK